MQTHSTSSPSSFTSLSQVKCIHTHPQRPHKSHPVLGSDLKARVVWSPAGQDMAPLHLERARIKRLQVQYHTPSIQGSDSQDSHSHPAVWERVNGDPPIHWSRALLKPSGQRLPGSPIQETGQVSRLGLGLAAWFFPLPTESSFPL